MSSFVMILCIVSLIYANEGSNVLITELVDPIVAPLSIRCISFHSGPIPTMSLSLREIIEVTDWAECTTLSFAD